MLPYQHAAEKQLVTKYRGGPEAAWAGSFSKCQLVSFLHVASAFLFRSGPKGSQQLSWSKKLVRNKFTVLCSFPELFLQGS